MGIMIGTAKTQAA